MNKYLNLKLYKNNNLVCNYENIKYNKENNTYNYLLDNINNKLIFEDNKLELIRENDEYCFSLKVYPDKNICTYILKEYSQPLDIVVDSAEYNYIDNRLELYYQLETDDEFTTVVIEFKE